MAKAKKKAAPKRRAAPKKKSAPEKTIKPDLKLLKKGAALQIEWDNGSLRCERGYVLYNDKNEIELVTSSKALEVKYHFIPKRDIVALKPVKLDFLYIPNLTDGGYNGIIDKKSKKMRVGCNEVKMEHIKTLYDFYFGDKPHKWKHRK